MRRVAGLYYQEIDKPLRPHTRADRKALITTPAPGSGFYTCSRLHQRPVTLESRTLCYLLTGLMRSIQAEYMDPTQTC